MRTAILTAPQFHDEKAAYAFVEARVWPGGRVCPHCGVVGQSGALKGKSTRVGLYKCYACRKPFTVKVGTIFEDSHIKLHLWLQAIFLLCASKKGISSNQLHRTLGVTLKSAWFMSHRIREAMKDTSGGSLGGKGKIVEADETFLGPNDYEFGPGGWRFQRGTRGKMKVVTLVERDGRARSVKVDAITAETVGEILARNVDRHSALATDESPVYRKPGRKFSRHWSVNHSKGQYVDGIVHSNTVEGFFSIFKRGMRGVYQKCDERHLHRYLAEFDFRYNNRAALGINDEQRAHNALKGTVGKRLTYRAAGHA